MDCAETEAETDEYSVIELDRSRVLEHVPPPPIGFAFGSGVEVGEELRSGRDESSTHQRELVVDQSSIKSSDEGTCRQNVSASRLKSGERKILTRNGSEEDQSSHSSDEESSPSNGARAELLKRLADALESTQSRSNALLSTVDNLPIPRDTQAQSHATGVDEERHSQMRRESVLRDSGDSTKLLDFHFVESRFDHVPSHCSLRTDERSDTEEGEGGARGESSTKEEVRDRGQEGKSDDSTEDSVRPLPEVDRLKLAHGDVFVLSASKYVASVEMSMIFGRGETYNRHSGLARYLLNSLSQSASPSGGMIPETTFHSVILSPDSVNLVNPPTTTMEKTIPAMTSRYVAT